ncbi:unnamed protein product [Coregonus sp. 'balchen']|nr:unnamed protein product [Coregonus sp. 'balchen']
MLRWILGGRDAQGSVEKNHVLFIGEEQPKNWFTELQVLKGHFDIVRFLVQIDDFSWVGPAGLHASSTPVMTPSSGPRPLQTGQQPRAGAGTFSPDCFSSPKMFASAGDDGLVLVWNVETGERLLELRGHSQQITAMTAYTHTSGENTHTSLITASSDRTLSVSLPHTHTHTHIHTHAHTHTYIHTYIHTYVKPCCCVS